MRVERGEASSAHQHHVVANEDETETGIKQRRLLLCFVCMWCVQQPLIEWRLSLLLQQRRSLVDVKVRLQREGVLVDSA